MKNQIESFHNTNSSKRLTEPEPAIALEALKPDIESGLTESPKYSIREIDATPYAASLFEGHRDFGYSLETALADVIDNSITAKATSVQLIANLIADEPFIAIVDNGLGMTEAELVDGMRLGSKNPKDERTASDLGRFGLGLKSASFSQCRSLTVMTRLGGKTSCARWDLDRVSRRNDWSLELIDHIENITGSEFLADTGTVVVWKKLDRLMGVARNHERAMAYANAELVQAEKHLRLVFHRFIEGSKPRLKLLLNGRQLHPIDPMAASHPSTQRDPEEILKLDKGDVHIRCYTLPHHKKMGREEWEEIGGADGHLKSQGLYIYRENRLIIMGGWLGLAKQTELTKLCRIAVDIPNTMDSEWKIDVKKASAQLPPQVRDRLKNVVERFVGTSKRTYSHKGKTLVDETRFPIWNRVLKDGQILFRPNLEHPLFRTYSQKLPVELREGFDTCLRLLGSGLPLEALHAELFGNAEAVVADVAVEADLKPLIYALAETMVEHGVPRQGLADALFINSILRANRDAVLRILECFFLESDI